MKSSILLAGMMMVMTGMAVFAEEKAATTTGTQTEAQAKHQKMTAEQREAMMNKRLERIKAKDPALYNELIALKDKDPKAFKAKMRELAKADAQGRTEKKTKKTKKEAN